MAASISPSIRKSAAIRRIADTRMATLSKPRRAPRVFRNGMSLVICPALSLQDSLSCRRAVVQIDGELRVAEERLAGKHDHAVRSDAAHEGPSPRGVGLRQPRAGHGEDLARG